MNEESNCERSLRQFFHFTELLYLQNVALKRLADEAGIDWTSRMLEHVAVATDDVHLRFLPLYNAAEDFNRLHEALQEFLGIKHG